MKLFRQIMADSQTHSDFNLVFELRSTSQSDICRAGYRTKKKLHLKCDSVTCHSLLAHALMQCANAGIEKRR